MIEVAIEGVRAVSSHLLAQVGDIPPGELRRVEVNGIALCVAHVEGKGFYAVSDLCSHQDQELSDGDLDGMEIECPAHGSRFHVESGTVRGLPATDPVQAYKVRVADNDVMVELPDGAGE